MFEIIRIKVLKKMKYRIVRKCESWRVFFSKFVFFFFQQDNIIENRFIDSNVISDVL